MDHPRNPDKKYSTPRPKDVEINTIVLHFYHDTIENELEAAIVEGEAYHFIVTSPEQGGDLVEWTALFDYHTYNPHKPEESSQCIDILVGLDTKTGNPSGEKLRSLMEHLLSLKSPFNLRYLTSCNPEVERGFPHLKKLLDDYRTLLIREKPEILATTMANSTPSGAGRKPRKSNPPKRLQRGPAKERP